jgi:hypothetical protein
MACAGKPVTIFLINLSFGGQGPALACLLQTSRIDRFTVEIQVNSFPHLEKRISLYKSQLIEEGKALGESLDEARSRAEIARNMKNLGLPPEMIEKATGLEPEAIKQL